jgi:SAM-dependent methyltransferase
MAIRHFLDIGDIEAENVRRVLQSCPGYHPDCAWRILDFGCGPGRVTAFLRKRLPRALLHGSDIDEEAITWARAKLGDVADFVTNGPMPPLPFEKGFFDFVFALSVFTHLPEDMQFAWLADLKRVLRNGGYMLASVHGENYLSGPFSQYKAAFHEKGFVYAKWFPTQGLPDFYGRTFHREDYIRQEWSKYFEIERVTKLGLLSFHDLVLCRKQGT